MNIINCNIKLLELRFLCSWLCCMVNMARKNMYFLNYIIMMFLIMNKLFDLSKSMTINRLL